MNVLLNKNLKNNNNITMKITIIFSLVNSTHSLSTEDSKFCPGQLISNDNFIILLPST